MSVVLADAGSTPAISTNYLKTYDNIRQQNDKKALNFNSLGLFYAYSLQHKIFSFGKADPKITPPIYRKTSNSKA